ncbi:MAG: hypothetical protein JXA97_07360 [Anaerolineales bacterium]|nr:hypothetical protein [Anaerolineales bacterium]
MNAEKRSGSPAHGLDGKPQLLLTAVLTISKVAVVVVAALTLVLSILAGASLLKAALRSGAAMIIVGMLAWFVNWYLERATLNQVQERFCAAVEQGSQNAAEWKA